MNTIISWLKRLVSERRMRTRFPDSVIHPGAMADAMSVLEKYSVLFPNVYLACTRLGRHSYVQVDSTICNAEIGPYCSIAGGVNIGLAMHPTNMVSTSPVFYDNAQPLPKFFTQTRMFTENMPRTAIGADVWIGQGALIKAGVSIGVGAVIGAGAIVTKDVPPYMIAGGNPCRVIRPRFNEALSKRLLSTCWWEFDEATIQGLAPYFPDPEAFCAQIQIEQLPKRMEKK